MNRGVVILISVVTLTIFAGLVNYGWQNRWGGEMDTKIIAPLDLAMPSLEEKLELVPEDFDSPLWQVLEPVRVPLLHQMTVSPRGTNLVPELRVRAFHNGSEAYFLFEWSDEKAGYVHDTAQWPDAVAVAFSMAKEPPAASIMMGFEAPVNMWQWKANLDAEFWGGPETGDGGVGNKFYTYAETADIPTSQAAVTSACQDILASRPGSITAKDKPAVTGRGAWRDGSWRVIVKRSLTTDDSASDIQLAPGKTHIAFAVWDGDKGDRGSRKSISEWVILDVKAQAPAPTTPAPKTSALDSRGSRPRVILAGLGVAGDEVKPRLIEIKAKRFQYMPAEITVRKGERITLRMESLDVTHGLYLDGYGIRMKARPGMVGKVTFVADKPGRFTFRCSETCGPFHPYMLGYLTVTPNTRFKVFAAVTLGVFVVAAVLSFAIKGTKKEAV